MKATDGSHSAARPVRRTLRPYVEPAPAAPGPPPPAEPRQRWRIVYAKDPEGVATSQRDDLAAWEAGLIASGLPIAGLDAPRRRPRILFAAPLSQGVAAERDLADLYLTRRTTVDVVRAGVIAALPAGHALVDLHDVWLGTAPLPADVIAADYRIHLAPGAPPAWDLATAARRLLALDSIERERAKGTGLVRYDLRPLLADISVIEPGPPAALRIRVRFDPQLGIGRADEVLAALVGLLGRDCPAASTVRERVVLASEG